MLARSEGKLGSKKALCLESGAAPKESVSRRSSPVWMKISGTEEVAGNQNAC